MLAGYLRKLTLFLMYLFSLFEALKTRGLLSAIFWWVLMSNCSNMFVLFLLFEFFRK